MIGYAMLYTVAVGVPVILASLAVSAVLRRYGRPERFVWLAGLGLSLSLPTVMLLSPMLTLPSGSAPATTHTGVIGLPPVVVVPDRGMGFGVGEILVGSWLLISTVLVIRWLSAVIKLERASRSWHSLALDGFDVWMTESLGPAVAGVLRPRVLVPTWLRSLPGSQRSLVLQHEQEHIRAKDPLLIATARLSRVLVPWNPAVWFLASRLVRAVELDCDRRVLRRSPDVEAYGRTLLNVSSRRPGRLVAAAAFAESHAPLRSRILAMTAPARTVSVFALLSATALGAVLLVGALQIPVPAVSVRLEIMPQASQTPVVTLPERDASASPGDASPDPRPSAAEEDPPSAAKTIEGLREELAARRAVRPEAGARSDQTGRSPAARLLPAARGGTDVPAEPTFTPYTVAPRILNREEVVRAMTEQYPALLRDAAIGGTVRVYFFIDADGIVQATRIDQSSGYEPLDQAALSVAGVYRFRPAMNRDEPVPVWVSFPITFQVR